MRNTEGFPPSSLIPPPPIFHDTLEEAAYYTYAFTMLQKSLEYTLEGMRA